MADAVKSMALRYHSPGVLSTLGIGLSGLWVCNGYDLAMVGDSE